MDLVQETLTENSKALKDALSQPDISTADKIQYKCSLHTSNALLKIVSTIKKIMQHTR